MANQYTSEITDANFETEVLKSNKPVLIDFWADWCGPCRMVAPHVDAIAQEYNGVLKVGKMDVDDNPAVPGRYGIVGIPTLMLFKGGAVVARITGAQPKDRIVAQILPHLDTQLA
ncbi:MAG: thioredoxin [Chloroflexi bacterium]|nr:thioredoxin [Ardenticatenaceae bacterium]MBL1129534.1 thioredoxin [Chloroflexota bacterium]NOG35616.1 thioredoxin [Chloroflexota bacterium]GIK58499.1 MAG: thioredoxin [Chloroflexota bacterium]